MKISVENKSRAKKVPVNVIEPEEKDEVPTPPEDYEANAEEDVWNDADEEPFVDDIYKTEYVKTNDEEDSNYKEMAMRDTARQLAEFEPADMRKVIKTARNLQKLVKPFKADDEEYKDVFDRISEEDNGWV